MVVDCYVDMDFSSLYGYEDPQDPICEMSRRGYVINVYNCPLLWLLKIQNEVDLSTLHYGYVALYQYFRYLFPKNNLIK